MKRTIILAGLLLSASTAFAQHYYQDGKNPEILSPADYVVWGRQEIVIPQNINAVASGKDKLYLHFSVTFQGNNTPTQYTICLADIPLTGQKPEYLKTWLPGKNYVYNLNVTSDYITCSVSVVDWIEDDMIDLN